MQQWCTRWCIGRATLPSVQPALLPCPTTLPCPACPDCHLHVTRMSPVSLLVNVACQASLAYLARFWPESQEVRISGFFKKSRKWINGRKRAWQTKRLFLGVSSGQECQLSSPREGGALVILPAFLGDSRGFWTKLMILVRRSGKWRNHSLPLLAQEKVRNRGYAVMTLSKLVPKSGPARCRNRTFLTF